jgi:hypothetical protein
MKKEVMLIGITDLGPPMLRSTEEIISCFFEKFNSKNTLTRLEYIQKVGEAVESARSFKLLKEANNKRTLKTSIEKINKALSKLIPALEEIDWFVLSVLINEIDKEDGYHGFSNIEPFREPGQYAEHVLKPFHQKIASSIKVLADTNELRRQHWKYDLSIKLVRLYKVITGNFPKNVGSDGRSQPLDFNKFVADISFAELKENLSERIIRKAIVDSKSDSGV